MNEKDVDVDVEVDKNDKSDKIVYEDVGKEVTRDDCNKNYCRDCTTITTV